MGYRPQTSKHGTGPGHQLAAAEVIVGDGNRRLRKLGPRCNKPQLDKVYQQSYANNEIKEHQDEFYNNWGETPFDGYVGGLVAKLVSPGLASHVQTPDKITRAFQEWLFWTYENKYDS